MPSESQQPSNFRVSVINRFRSEAIALDQEHKFPVSSV